MPWGVVAGAAITAGAGAAEGHSQRGAARDANKRNAWIGDAGKDLVKRAQTIASRTYTPYEGNRVAGMSTNEQRAYNIADDASRFNESRSYLDKAGAAIDGVSNWGTETMDKYMNPYVDKVVGTTLRKENEAYQGRLGELRGSAAVRGAFGGDRATLLEAQETGQHLQNVGDLTAKGYSDAYKSALDTWQADNNTRIAAADSYRAVGGDINRLNSSQITDLLRTGGADRLLRQMDLDVDYQDFIGERDWDVNNLEPLFRAVNSANGSPGQNAIPADNTASSLMGMAATLVGYFGQRDGAPKATGGTGAGGGTAAPVGGIGGSGMGDYWAGGNSGVMLG